MKNINIIIGTSLSENRHFQDIITFFSNGNKLFWFDEGNSLSKNIDKNLCINNLSEVNDKEGIYIVLVSPDTKLGNVENKKLMRVYERNDSNYAVDDNAVVVDDYAQVGQLAKLDQYPGIRELILHFGSSKDHFSNMVVDRYKHALDLMQSSKRAVVFGAQRLGEFVAASLKASGIDVEAFVDNGKSKQGTTLMGAPVIALSELADKNIPIFIATTRFSKSIAEQLKNTGYKNYFPYPVMSILNDDLFPHEIPYIGIQDDLSKNIARHLGLFLSFMDDKSRKVHDGLIEYRMKYDASYADAVADEYERQYFDKELIGYSDDGVFVDLGGYDGDTVEKYIQFGDATYKKIYLFEPDQNILGRAKERLKGFSNIEYVPTGAYSKDGELRFSASGRTNGFFTDAGELVIPVRKLDTVVKEAPALIKMDIEGSEKDALIGATQALQKNKPKLAIAAYHFANDLWRLVDVIREINPSYRFYLRHYSETGLESVVYAV